MNTWPPPQRWRSVGCQIAATRPDLTPRAWHHPYSSALDVLGRLARGAK